MQLFWPIPYKLDGRSQDYNYLIKFFIIKYPYRSHLTTYLHQDIIILTILFSHYYIAFTVLNEWNNLPTFILTVTHFQIIYYSL